MPMTGRSLEMASSTRRTDFLRPTSMGMIEPGKRTELRRGRTEMYSGISTGPSGAVFLDAIPLIVIWREPRRDNFVEHWQQFQRRRATGETVGALGRSRARRMSPSPLFVEGQRRLSTSPAEGRRAAAARLRAILDQARGTDEPRVRQTSSPAVMRWK